MEFPSFSLIVTAAGSSERFRNSHTENVGKKEFELLDDRSVLFHAIIPFLTLPSLKSIVVTYPAFMRDECEVALDNLTYALEMPLHLIEGGENRQESVYLALRHLAQHESESSFVAIHDGARPFVSPELIIGTLATASVVGAAVPGVIIHDAVKRIDEGGFICESIERKGISAIQTPQIFRFPEILTCHEQARAGSKNYIDDSEIFADYGNKVALSSGDRENVKITTFEDLERGRSRM